MTTKSDLTKLTLFIAVLTVITLQSCPQNQYFDISTSQCVNCQNNCAQCSKISTNCTSCVSSYYLQNNTCMGCPQSCSSCNSSSICTSCKQNYYIKNYTCLTCGKNCMLCNSTNSCNSCQVGYDIKANCLSCTTQFFYNPSLNGCESCPQGCLDCADKTYCFKCDKNYVFINNSCQFTDANQTSSVQTQNTENAQSSGKKIFFIILGVLVAFIIVSCIACTIYYCLRKKIRKIKKEGDSKNLKASNKVSNTTLKIEKDSVIEPCLICKHGDAELASSCGHFFHNKCYQMQEKRCPVCPQDFSVAETYFQQSKNKDIELESEYSGYREKDDEVNNKDDKKMVMEMGSLQ